MALPGLFESISTLPVNTNGQVVFPLTPIEIPQSTPDSLLIYRHTIHYPNVDYTVTAGPDQLNWINPVNTEAGERLYLLHAISGGNALFDVQTVVNTTSFGQSSYELPEPPADPLRVLIYRNHLVFLSQAGDFSVNGTMLNWTGIPMQPGDKLTVLYKSEE
jgi:hypothetical protein